MNNAFIQFELVTPERLVLSEAVLQATIPTELGEITILPNHIPLVAVLKSGVVEVRRPDNSSEIMAVSDGFVEVFNGKIVILADTAERAAELDEERIREAQAKAEALKTAADKEAKVDFADVAARLEKEFARFHAVNRWKKHHHSQTKK